MTKKLTISKVAKEVGIGVETVRYYERIGLISQPEKPAVGYRVYDDKTLTQLFFIKRAKTLGFSLQDIAEIMTLGEKKCQATKTIASQKLQNIKSKITDLELISQELEKMIKACEANPNYNHCPIVTAIAKR